MASVQDYISQIEAAVNGKEARKPIADCIKFIFENGGDADTLDYHHADYFALKVDLYNGFYRR